MPIENVTYVGSAAGGQAPPVNKQMGKDEFMHLLITQMSNQDPMNPMKDQDFIAQLAQFSSLEQMENMNGTLTESLNWNYLLSQTISNTMATSLIGRTVRADSSQVYLETAGAADIALDLDRPANELTVEILDSDGNTVKTITKRGLAAGDLTINWDGTDEGGVQVPSGVYSVKVSGVDANGNTFNPSQFLEGKVDGITYKDGYALLSIKGQQLPLSSVQEVKEG